MDPSERRNEPGECRMCLAIPGKIIEMNPTDRTSAVVDVAGVRRRVDLGLLANDPPSVGDWVLIHVGFAMSKISEGDASEQMHTLSLLGEVDAAIQEVRGYGAPEEPAPDSEHSRLTSRAGLSET